MNTDNVLTKQEETPETEKKEKTDKSFLDILYGYRDYHAKEFDKGITFISSAIFGISFAFIEKIVKLENANSIWLLISGWCFLAIAIVLSIANHFINMRALDYYIKKYNKRKKTEIQKFKAIANYLIYGINILTLLLTVGGTLFIIFFINRNL